jgi:transcription initiation factor TFIIIB Brf1 subunit/transcription initiation factor TFIIB
MARGRDPSGVAAIAEFLSSGSLSNERRTPEAVRGWSQLTNEIRVL